MEEIVEKDTDLVITELKTIPKNIIKEKCLEYFNGDDLATEVWISKYCLKDSKGDFYEMTPADTHRRMAKEFARIESKYKTNLNGKLKKISEYGQRRKELTEEIIFEYFDHFKYIVPQGSIMASLGNPFTIASLSNCIVLPELYDSYGGIMFADQQLVQLMKRRCGVGLDVSSLRPEGYSVTNSAGTSTGAISFMERFSNTTREVAQNGRRGALICSIDVSHINSPEFAVIKNDLSKVTGANISIKLTNEFMNAVKNDLDFTLRWPITGKPKITKTIKAKDLWNTIVTSARNTAEPGLIFWDRQHNYSTSSVYPEYKNITTNPCITGDAIIETNIGKLKLKEVIKRIIQGDYLETLSYNTKNNKLEYKEIEAGMLTRKNANIIELELEDGEKLKLTPDHRVYTKKEGWIEASLLTKTNILIKINSLKTIKNGKIKSINIIQNEDVYDIKVKDNHNFFANNILVHNCSEIAMGGNDSCRLISINLFGFIDNPFTKTAKFNFTKFYETTYDAQRLMDDLVDLELESIEKILNKIETDSEPDYIKDVELRTWKALYDNGKAGRRTGLGFTALADTIAALNIKFDSSEALNIVDKIMKTKCEAEFNSSIDMSIERGSFTGFNIDIEETSHFVQMLKQELPDVYTRMMKYGRRNVSISTTAPTGSVSMLTQTSSGIEPVFMLSYTRRKKVNTSDKDIKIDFTDQSGDKWQHYEVLHPKFKLWKEITGKTKVEDSPYYKSTAEEINWLNRLKLQSICQKYITHSISSTCNLPEDTSIEKVGEIYMTAWELGLKGITVYRAGSRTGVLISKEDSKKDNIKIQKTTSPRRPKELPCDIHHITAEGKKWIVIIGLLEGDPYEVFSFRPKSIHIPTKIKSGKLAKVKQGRYDLELEDGLIIDDIRAHFETDEQEALTRMISTSLRHGADINFVYEQLSKSHGTIVAFSKAIGRAIKKYIVNKELTGEKCSNCGSSNIILEEGCQKCADCGSSKC